MSWWSDVRSSINAGVEWVRNTTDDGRRVVYSVKGGAREVWKSYTSVEGGATTAANHFVQSHAKAYNRALEAGWVPGGRKTKLVVGRFIPKVNYIFLVQDINTFGQGFTRSWYEYGR